MVAWIAMAAMAREPSIGSLVMPITPSEGQDSYMGMIEEPEAGATQWRSDAEGFTCHGNQDWLEVVVARDTWPAAVPKKLACEADDGRKVKVKVEIRSARHEPMFVADGTLVMPREKGASAIYEGPPSSDAFVVQQGRNADLYIHCDVLPGPRLEVIVDPEAKDGVGFCLLKDKFGATTKVPVSIVTIR